MDDKLKERIKDNLKSIDKFLNDDCDTGFATRDDVLKALIVDALGFIAKRLDDISLNIRSLDLKTEDKTNGKGKIKIPVIG